MIPHSGSTDFFFISPLGNNVGSSYKFLNLGSGVDEIYVLPGRDVTCHCLVSGLSKKGNGLILGGRNVQDIATFEDEKNF